MVFTPRVCNCANSNFHEWPPAISGPSKRYGIVLLMVALLLLLGETGPRPTDVHVHLYVLLLYGSLGLVRGVHNMLVTRDEVIVAPFAGVLFSVSATALMADQWDSLSALEEYAAFATIVVIGGCQTWLVFRGLLIGRLPLAWSKAGLVALQRGRFQALTVRWNASKNRGT